MESILDQFTPEVREEIRKAVLAEMGRKSGQAKRGKKERFSLAKQLASRENGKKGGRPRGITGFAPVKP